MADNSAIQLEKLENDQKKAAAVLADANAKLANFRKANRGPKLVELKKDIEDYGFTAVEIFGEVALLPSKPRAKVKAGKRAALSIVKYKDDSGNTWGGGKGPVPKWITAIRDAKGDIEKFRVAP